MNVYEQFLCTPPWWKTAPLKRPTKRSITQDPKRTNCIEFVFFGWLFSSHQASIVYINRGLPFTRDWFLQARALVEDVRARLRETNQDWTFQVWQFQANRTRLTIELTIDAADTDTEIFALTATFTAATVFHVDDVALGSTGEGAFTQNGLEIKACTRVGQLSFEIGF